MLTGTIDRNNELDGPDKVRVKTLVPRALSEGLEHETELKTLQVPKSAVDQPRRPAGGSRAVICRVYQRDVQTAKGRIAGDAGPSDSGPYDQYIKCLKRQSLETLAATHSERAGISAMSNIIPKRAKTRALPRPPPIAPTTASVSIQAPSRGEDTLRRLAEPGPTTRRLRHHGESVAVCG